MNNFIVLRFAPARKSALLAFCTRAPCGAWQKGRPYIRDRPRSSRVWPQAVCKTALTSRAAQHRGDIGIRRRYSLDAESFNEYVRDIRREEPWQRGA
jgi:hypothetical protein